MRIGSLDVDDDEDLDLLAVDCEGPLMLLRNETKSSNHWLKLSLHGRARDVFGYGVQTIVRSGREQRVARVSP